MKILNFNFRALCLCSTLLFSLNANAQTTTTDTSKPRKQLFELSFGSTMLFISNSDIQKIQDAAKLTIPTNTMLFFAEFRPQMKTRIPVFLNIPTESKQFIVTDSVG